MMSTKSRQVLKKRKGEFLPFSTITKRRFSSVIYLDSELKNLDLVLDENDINLEG